MGYPLDSFIALNFNVYKSSFVLADLVTVINVFNIDTVDGHEPVLEQSEKRWQWLPFVQKSFIIKIDVSRIARLILVAFMHSLTFCQ